MKKWLIGVIILLLIIALGSSFYIINKNSIKTHSIEEVKEMCNIGYPSNECSSLTCDGNIIYVEGYTSQEYFDSELFLKPQWNTYSSEYISRFSITQGFGGAGGGLYIQLDPSLFLENNITNEEKLLEASNQLKSKIGESYIKTRKVSVKVEIKEKECYNPSGECTICTRFVMKSLDDFVLLPEGDVTLDKEELMKDIESCNEVMISKNITDKCFGHHHSDTGCIYVSDIKVCPGYSNTWKTYLEYYELSYQESKDFCLKFTHKGLTTNCLRIIASDSSKEECFDFAEDNEYLTAICNLEEGEKLNPFEFAPKSYNQI